MHTHTDSAREGDSRPAVFTWEKRSASCEIAAGKCDVVVVVAVGISLQSSRQINKNKNNNKKKNAEEKGAERRAETSTKKQEQDDFSFNISAPFKEVAGPKKTSRIQAEEQDGAAGEGEEGRQSDRQIARRVTRCWQCCQFVVLHFPFPLGNVP